MGQTSIAYFFKPVFDPKAGGRRDYVERVSSDDRTELTCDSHSLYVRRLQEDGTVDVHIFSRLSPDGVRQLVNVKPEPAAKVR